MIISNSHINRIIIFGILVVLYAPLIFKILLYHFDIRGIYPATIFLMFTVAALTRLMNASFMLAKIDILVVGFFIYVISRFYIDGSDYFLTLFLTQAVFPYALGRIAGNLVNYSFVPYLYLIIGISVFFLGLEFFVSPDSFEGDRMRLFEKNLSESGDEIGGATQHYAGSLFGAGACISWFHILKRGTENIEIFNSKRVLIHYTIFFLCLAGLIYVSSKTSVLIAGAICLYLTVKTGFVFKVLKLFFISAAFLSFFLVFSSSERISFFSNALLIDFGGINIQEMCFTPEFGGSVLGRISMILDSVKIWISEPFFGVGPGNFGLLDCDVSPKRDFTHPHNIFFGLLSELGLIGLVWFSVIVIMPIIRTYSSNYSLYKAQIVLLFSFEIGQSFFVSSGYLGNFGIYLFMGILITMGLRRDNRTVLKRSLVNQ